MGKSGHLCISLGIFAPQQVPCFLTGEHMQGGLKKPVSSQENTQKEDCLVVKDHTSKEDGEVWACSCLSEKSISSQENTYKDDCLVVKEH
eukprot:2554786-Ditylum_brightwellii.AAC.1